ncbi:helix-turn-helix transcriptional regulator [Bacteriovorax sp. PP10]|uniref:Helix-turn-helix transcriptional regulator n=1 Tax=Bacteriovorax antarcticus TaxID=3088717 RepID=A0ABU5VXQ2_9BACT|nr:helix-turn-helix transcriptional regulator [Bacteriovorax sp. PP10]MEA9357128.1 helix-turn-helix transcriptional regulator [Bacteriovorax sp. PP10]
MTIKKPNLGLALFIKSHRLGEELTQAQMAKCLGISKQRLSDIENDRNNVSIKLCQKFAKKLGFPAEWLVKLALQDQINKAKLNLKVVHI